MKRLLLAPLLSLFLFSIQPAEARAYKCMSCVRSSDGRIKRSQSARAQFKKQRPCPVTGKSSGPCPGYVIDHVHPLKRGGPDTPSNMQWQTRAAAQAKDRYE